MLFFFRCRYCPEVFDFSVIVYKCFEVVLTTLLVLAAI
jgi:hypothetical protein